MADSPSSYHLIKILREAVREELRRAIREELTSGDAAASELVNAILKEIRDRVATEATLSNVLPPLTLIPAYYYDGYHRYGYHAYSGGEFFDDPDSITGGMWCSYDVGDWIEFGFRGPVVGVVFGYKAGIAKIYIDGQLVETVDVEGIKGPEVNSCYIVKTDLTDEHHVIRVEAASAELYVVGVVCDSRRNFYQFTPFLYDRLHQIISYPQAYTRAEVFRIRPWNNSLVGAGGSVELFITQYRHLAFYVKVDRATDITFEGTDGYNRHTIEVINFAGPGEATRRYSDLPYYTVRWTTSNTAVITLSFVAKT